MPDYTVIPNTSVPHPFSLLAASDELIFVTGLAWPEGDAAEQTRRTIEEMEKLLQQAGSGLSEIVYLRVTVSSREYVPAVDVVLDELMPKPRCAAGALTICELVAPELKVELEAIAQRGARMVLPEA